MHLRDLTGRKGNLSFRGPRQHTEWGRQMPQTALFMTDYLVRPSGWDDCDPPNMSTDTHQQPCKAPNGSWKALHAYKAPSLRKSTVNHFHRCFYWSAWHFLSHFFPLSHPHFFFWVRVLEDFKFQCFFFFSFSITFLQGKSWERLM